MRLEFESRALAHPSAGNGSATDVNSADDKINISQMLEEGIKAAQAGNRAEARVLLLRAAEVEPENENVWLWLASISEYPEELLVFLNNILNVNPNNARALEWLHATKALLAKSFVQRGVDASNEANIDLARHCFSQAIVHDFQNEMAWLWLASISDSTEEKISHLQKVLSINPNNETAQTSLQTAKNQVTESLLQKANKAAMSGERESADETISEILKQSPEVEEAWILKANLADSFSEKIISYEKALSLNPNNEAAHAGLALLRTTIARAEHTQTEQSVAGSNLIQEPKIKFEESRQESVAQVEENSPKENTYKPSAEMLACPFCRSENESNAFVCGACRTILSLSDLEMMLANTEVDVELLRRVVGRMEAEKSERDFETQELKMLAVGHINLKNLRQGILHLQAALRMNPNDVVLGSQINSLKIRLSEIEQQESNYSSMTRGKKIMVVDDSATVRRLISSKLEKVGHEVWCAVDGIEAMEKIKHSVPDLILLDINMPQMDGYQVCKMIRSNEATKDVPVVMISGNDGFFDKVRGRMSGTTGYITKPFGPEALMKIVESYIV